MERSSKCPVIPANSRNDGNKAIAHLGIHYDDTPYAKASGTAWRPLFSNPPDPCPSVRWK